MDKIYDRHKLDFSSKYTDKGNICEDDSIELVSNHYNLGMVFKNEEYKENDFLTGTPDVILNDLVIDIKNSYDHTTFPLFDPIDKGYQMQLQGYMCLFDKSEAWLTYTLMNLPLELLEKEISYHPDLEEDDVIRYFEYDHLPIEKRIKRYIVKRDDEFLKLVENRVNLCQQYIDQLIKEL